MGSPFDQNCVERVAPADTRGHYENLTYDELRRPRCKRVYAQKDSKAASQTRLNAKNAIERKRARHMEDAMTTLGESIEASEKRSLVDALNSAFVSEKEVAKGSAQWRDSRMEDKYGATEATVLESDYATISARAADQCVKSLGQGLMQQEEWEHAAQVRGAKGRGAKGRG